MHRGAWQAQSMGVAQSSITEQLTFTFFKGGRGLTGIKRQDNKRILVTYLLSVVPSPKGRQGGERKKLLRCPKKQLSHRKLIILWEVGGVGTQNERQENEASHRNIG